MVVQGGLITGGCQDVAAYQVLHSAPILSDTLIGLNMEHTPLRLLGAITVMAAALASGCNVYDSSLLPVEGGLLPDGRPQRPTFDDPTVNMELVFRITDVQLNDEVDWLSTGRNMDGLITTLEDTRRQCTPPAGSLPPIDGPGGIDNAMGEQLLRVVVNFVIPCLEPALDASHVAGRGTLMLWVQNWNGTSNDASVDVAMLVAADATSADLEDVQWDDTNHRLVQASDGVTEAPEPSGAVTDQFFIRPDSFTGGANPKPRLRDASAYIADGVIVYEIPSGERIPLNAGIGSLNIVFTDGLVLAELNDGFTAIDKASLSGRFSLNALLDAGESIGVCGDARQDVEEQFEEFLDVMSNPATPPSDDLSCDAMSLGIPFRGTLATIPREGGRPVRAGSDPPLPNACAAGVRPCDAFTD